VKLEGLGEVPEIQEMYIRRQESGE
jgi:cobalamin biosynthesis Co2+ chelatase CbiK